MIPSVLDLSRAVDFLECRFRWTLLPDHRALAECRWAAEALEPSVKDEPAAIFFAFADADYRLGDARLLLPPLLARNQARLLGLRLLAGPEELDALRDDIAAGKVSYNDARVWFAMRLSM